MTGNRGHLGATSARLQMAQAHLRIQILLPLKKFGGDLCVAGWQFYFSISPNLWVRGLCTMNSAELMGFLCKWAKED